MVLCRSVTRSVPSSPFIARLPTAFDALRAADAPARHGVTLTEENHHSRRIKGIYTDPIPNARFSRFSTEEDAWFCYQ